MGSVASVYSKVFSLAVKRETFRMRIVILPEDAMHGTIARRRSEPVISIKVHIASSENEEFALASRDCQRLPLRLALNFLL